MSFLESHNCTKKSNDLSSLLYVCIITVDHLLLMLLDFYDEANNLQLNTYNND